MDVLLEGCESQSWFSDIQKGIRQRDFQEKEPFAALIATNESLKSQLTFSHDRTEELEESVVDLKRQLHDITMKIQSYAEKAADGSTSVEKVSALEKRKSRLEEENASMYKVQASYAQRLIEAGDKTVKLQALIDGKDEAIFRLTDQVRVLEQKREDLIQLVREKDKTIQIIQDELATCQLELQGYDEKMRKLESENRTLIERWLRKMNEEADKMNEVNQFYETMAEKKQQFSSSLDNSQSNSLTLSKLRPGLNRSCLPVKVKHSLKAHVEKANDISISSDGTLISSVGDDKRVKVIDASNGTVKYTLTGSLQSVMCTQFSPGNDLLLAGGNDNSIRLWRVDNGRPKYTLTGHIGNVWAAKFTPDSNRIISGSHDRTIKIWDVRKGACIRSIFTYSSVNDLCLTDDAGVISGHLDNQIRFWDTKTGDCVKDISGIHSGQITSVAVSPEQYQVLTCSRDNTLKIIDIRTFSILATFVAEGLTIGYNYSKACFSSDGAYVAVGSIDGNIYIFNANSSSSKEKGKLETVLKYHKREPVLATAWSPLGDGKIVSCDKEGIVAIWE